MYRQYRCRFERRSCASATQMQVHGRLTSTKILPDIGATPMTAGKSSRHHRHAGQCQRRDTPAPGAAEGAKMDVQYAFPLRPVGMDAYDVLIRGGTILDGSGSAPFPGDVAIRGDTIEAVGPRLADARGSIEVDADGMAVAPGFINMLSWATESLIEDGRSQSDTRQGVTLEVFGEGRSMGPLNETMKHETLERQ